MKIALQILAIAFLILHSLLAQAQTIRGTVRDADNGTAVTGATVALRFSRGGATPVSLATNPLGEFVFEKIRAGYYHVEITAIGFESQTIAEVNVAAGKEQVFEVALRRSAAQLAEVTISATQPGRRQILPLGEIPLTRDQTLRFPAMFFDPARLATAYPGVSQTDDGTNSLSIRGNSPASVRWRLEGVDIVNPNHLPNAGTFSDRPAAASGGILMFSAQLLDNSSLLTGAMPAGYGDALGGIMDMNLRRGNNRQHEFTAQAGLIGLDLAAEGPIGNKGKNAYLVNYRYSTVGLLGQLGVSFGDEQIHFQDFSFNLNFKGKRGGNWSVFGLGGLSENIFRHKTDSTEIKAYKDFFDIDFESRTGVLGVSNWTPLGKKAWIKTSIAASGQHSIRRSDSPIFQEGNNSDDMDESRLSGSVTLSNRIGKMFQVQIGAQIQESKFDVASDYPGATQPRAFAKGFVMLQPWVQISKRSRNQKNLSTLGLHSVFRGAIYPLLSGNKTSYQPRFSFTRKLNERQRLSLAAGIYAQEWQSAYPKESQSQKIEIGYSLNLARVWQFRASIYRQGMNNVPYFNNERYSPLNSSEFVHRNNQVEPTYGLGLNQGFELNLERNLSEGWFLLANASVFESKFTQNSSSTTKDWVPTRWDMGFISNLTFGKEWQREKRPGKERTIGLNARAVWTGGVREADIDLPASQGQRTTIIDETRGYYRSNPDYFRLDLRVYWRKNLGNRRNSTFALDLQNLTGQQNLAYHYYDPYTDKVESKFQLGTIPNFSWRVEF
ncbi:MAG: carboxypeptidase regulatory-like domain-containing protein [Saprospiraceae bacterium]